MLFLLAGRLAHKFYRLFLLNDRNLVLVVNFYAS